MEKREETYVLTGVSISCVRNPRGGKGGLEETTGRQQPFRTGVASPEMLSRDARGICGVWSVTQAVSNEHVESRVTPGPGAASPRGPDEGGGQCLTVWITINCGKL